jgi:hypothetical protein
VEKDPPGAIALGLSDPFSAIRRRFSQFLNCQRVSRLQRQKNLPSTEVAPAIGKLLDSIPIWATEFIFPEIL